MYIEQRIARIHWMVKEKAAMFIEVNEGRCAQDMWVHASRNKRVAQTEKKGTRTVRK